MQREMPFFQQVGEPEMLSELLINRLKSEADAISLCWHKRRVKFSQRGAAVDLGISYSHLSNILSGKKYMPNDKRIQFQCLCGNWAIRQYEDSIIGAKTVFETPEQRRIRELEQELARRAA
jgi:hypothetical protein